MIDEDFKSDLRILKCLGITSSQQVQLLHERIKNLEGFMSHLEHKFEQYDEKLK